MTTKELQIKSIMDKLLLRELTEAESSILIEKSLRQTQRIKKKYKEEGIAGLSHKLRGKASNHQCDRSRYVEAIQIVKEKYPDYGPTLASEMLLEKHLLKISIPILRREMIENHIWKAKKRKFKEKQFTARKRKEHYGEMVQYDGSYHKWFEGRKGSEYQCLLVAIDDATGLVTAKFSVNEGLKETFTFWQEYTETNGKPLSIYLDKFATYKVNYPTATDDKELPTQFGRVCKNLGIQLIFANTPQAKGRVERMNKTLQDRLVKALREANISGIEEANIFLKNIFLPKFNKQFQVQAESSVNLHIPLREDEKQRILHIFSEHKQRKISNDYIIAFENKYYQLYRKKDGGYMIKPGESITVEKHLNGEVKISKDGIYITHTISFEKAVKGVTLLTAPISYEDIEQQREKQLLQAEQEKEEKKRKQEEQKKGALSYYQKTGKTHPFIAGAIVTKKPIITHNSNKKLVLNE